MTDSSSYVDLAGVALDKIQLRYPYSNGQNTDTNNIILFLNGTSRYGDLTEVVSSINSSAGIILVDGGAHSFLDLLSDCTKHNLHIQKEPLSVIGDFDSIDPSSLAYLKKNFPKMEVVHLNRDKDYTDFEATLQMIRLAQINNVFVLGGFGGRVDQTVGNILTIFRENYFKKVVFIGDFNEQIFSLICGKNDVLSHVKGCFLTLLPLCGPFEFQIDKTQLKHCENNTYECLQDTIDLSLHSGQALCVVQKSPSYSFRPDFDLSTTYSFNEPGQFARDIHALLYCLINPYFSTIHTKEEKIFAMKEGQSVSFDVEMGKTFSLFPLGGIAHGVNTQGLQWNLTNVSLSPEFMSISNITTHPTVQIQVQSGQILVIQKV